MKLTRYEKFILLVRSNNLYEARKICGSDIKLMHALLLLTSNYNYYKKDI